MRSCHGECGHESAENAKPDRACACLDELPSTAPLPTLRTRMANEKARHLFIHAAQACGQLASIIGETDARALFGSANVLIMFGGSMDVAFNKGGSDLVGTTRVTRARSLGVPQVGCVRVGACLMRRGWVALIS